MCFCAFSAEAQDIDKHKKLAWQKYENFKPYLKNGEILEDAGLSVINTKDFSGNSVKSVSYDLWLQLYQQMYFGSKDETLTNPDSLKRSVSNAVSRGQLPVLYLKTPYLRINPKAFVDQTIDTTSIPWKVKSNAEISELFELDTITIIATPLNGFGIKSNRFFIDESFVIVRCNSNATINNVSINDLSKKYPFIIDSKRLKIHEGESEFELSIQSIPSDQLPLPSITEGVQQFEVIPSSVYDEKSKQIIPNYGKKDIKGLVTIFPGRDQNGKIHTTLNKVLIFTDGIDFGVFGISNPEFDIENPDKSTFLNYGERGASMLMKGQSLEFSGAMATRWIPLAEYDAFENCPKMIETLRNEGYDFMFLDFKDGAGYIQDNAMVLSELLQSLNNKAGAYLTGKLPFGTSNISSIYLVGPSMGGQVVRYALNYLENHGERHCVEMTGLFDSPNNGANIPMSVQYAMDELSFVSYAKDIRDRKLNSSAARQLLLEHYSTGGTQHTLRTDLVSEMTNLGNYPEYTYIAAMSNGSGLGVSQPIQPSDKMFYSQKLGAILNVEGYTNPGLPTPKGQLLFECTYFSLIKNKKYTTNQIPWETLPGGVFKGLDPNPYIKFNYDNFCFIPITSGLGDTTNNWNQSAIQGFETPFNGIFYNQTKNDVHVKVDFSGSLNPSDPMYGNADFFRFRMHQLDKKPEHLQVSEQFNYGNKMFATLHSTIVDSGAVLYFSNATLLSGWGVDSSEKIKTSGLDEYAPSECDPNVLIHINKGGILEIGTPKKNPIIRNAIVRLTAGSTLILDGKLKIHPGSTLIIEEGAKIILNAGNEILLLDNNSNLLVKGDLIIKSKSLETEGSGKFAIDHSAQISKIEFNGTSSIHFGKNATWKSIVLELGDHTKLILPQTVDLKIESGTTVDLGTNALIETEANLNAERVTFQGKNKSIHQGIRLSNTATANITGAKFLYGSPGLWVETSSFNQHTFKNLLFKENVTGFVSINCSPLLTSSSFVGNDVAYYFENNPYNSIISKSQFKNNQYGILGIQTLGSKINIIESNFDNGTVGIDVTGGITEVGCSRLANLSTGIKGTRQEISFLPGNIEFYNNLLDVEGVELYAWDLENTGTRFSTNGDIQIEFIQGTRSLIPDANGYFISGAGNLLNRDMYTNSTKSSLPRMYFFDQSFNTTRAILFTNCGSGYSQCLVASKPGCWNNYNSEALSSSLNNEEIINRSKSKTVTVSDLDSLLSTTSDKFLLGKSMTDIYLKFAQLSQQSRFTTESEEQSYLEWIELLRKSYISSSEYKSLDLAKRLDFQSHSIEFYLQIQEFEKAKSLLEIAKTEFKDPNSKSIIAFWDCHLNHSLNTCLHPSNRASSNSNSPTVTEQNLASSLQPFADKITRFEVYTSTGQLIYTGNNSFSDLQNSNTLPPGIYLIRTTTLGNSSTRKLIVQ